ncbi:MAG: hypothetical protein LBM62_05180 [Mediterranea sp.]|jgi:Tfp pilus assembly protein PilP|nr:hypothetical protein [Mediterranea sp.]
MKTKKFTVPLLLILSIVIWGTIAWKVYAAMHEPSDAIPVIAATPKPVKPEEPKLLLNYKDPFLGDYPPASQANEEKPVQKVSPVVRHTTEPIREVAPDFTYKGFMRMGKEVKALVELDGKSIQLKVGDQLGVFKIQLIEPHKLTVLHQSRKYELSVQ